MWPLVTAWYQGCPSSPGAPSASSQESMVGLPAEEPQTNCPPRGRGLREEAQAARPLLPAWGPGWPRALTPWHRSPVWFPCLEALDSRERAPWVPSLGAEEATEPGGRGGSQDGRTEDRLPPLGARRLPPERVCGPSLASGPRHGKNKAEAQGPCSWPAAGPGPPSACTHGQRHPPPPPQCTLIPTPAVQWNTE